MRHTTAVDVLNEDVEQSTIAIRLGHELIETTQIYLDADLAMKQSVLDKTTPPEGSSGRTIAPVISFVQPLSGSTLYAYSRPQPAIRKIAHE